MHKLQIGLSFISLLLSSSCLAQNSVLVLPETEQKISFTWLKDSVHGKQNEHAALLIPVKLKGCPRQFYMQFDTGSPYSMFYRNKLKGIRQRYPEVPPLADTASEISQFRFTAGNTPVLAKQIAVNQFEDKDIDWSENAQEIIGTIGADLFSNSVLSINYPDRYILIGNKITDKSGIHWFGLINTGRGILFPATIRGKQTNLYFDTGSSAFELLVDKEMAMSLATPGAAVSTFNVESWDKELKATSVQTTDSVMIASEKFPLRRVAFIEGVNNKKANAMKNMGIGGMTGNSLFLDVELVIDTKDNRFGIKPIK